MKTNIILIYIVVLLALVSGCPKAYSVEYKPFIGKSITYYNTDSPQINKNEHIQEAERPGPRVPSPS